MSSWEEVQEAVSGFLSRLVSDNKIIQITDSEEDIVFNEHNSVEVKVIRTYDSVDCPGKQDWDVEYPDGSLHTIKGVYLKAFKDSLEAVKPIDFSHFNRAFSDKTDDCQSDQ